MYYFNLGAAAWPYRLAALGRSVRCGSPSSLGRHGVCLRGDRVSGRLWSTTCRALAGWPAGRVLHVAQADGAEYSGDEGVAWRERGQPC